MIGWGGNYSSTGGRPYGWTNLFESISSCFILRIEEYQLQLYHPEALPAGWEVGN